MERLDLSDHGCKLPPVLRLKELRDAHDPQLSQEKLAYLAGVSVKTVRRAERGEGVTSGTLAAFARALGVSIGDLFQEGSAA